MPMPDPSDPPADRRAAWWAWPVILMVPVLLIAAERWLPAAEAEAGLQQDLSLLAVLQFQAKLVIATHGSPGAQTGELLSQLESYAGSDGTVARLRGPSIET